MAQVNYQIKRPVTGTDPDAFLGWLSAFGLGMIVLAGLTVADRWNWGGSTETVRGVAPLLAAIVGYLVGFRLPASAPRLAIASGTIFGIASAYACHLVFGGWAGALISWPLVTLDQIGLHRRRIREGGRNAGAR